LEKKEERRFREEYIKQEKKGDKDKEKTEQMFSLICSGPEMTIWK
jgi:hypothetical protein